MLAGDRGLGLQRTANQRHELPEELARGGRSRNTLRYLEQSSSLLRRQSSMAARGLRDWGNRLLKSRAGEIFPPRLGIVAHSLAHLVRISACSRGSALVLHITAS